MASLGFCQICNDGKLTPVVGKRELARCQYHYKIQLNLKSKKKSQEKNRVKTKFTVAGAEQSTELVRWFKIKMVTSAPLCENCGLFISISSQEHWHGCQAHILPKKNFKSVATHPDNHMVLDWYGCACHGQYDSSWHNASKMPVFKIAKERFLRFKDLIDPSEYKYIPDVFLED